VFHAGLAPGRGLGVQLDAPGQSRRFETAVQLFQQYQAVAGRSAGLLQPQAARIRFAVPVFQQPGHPGHEGSDARSQPEHLKVHQKVGGMPGFRVGSASRGEVVVVTAKTVLRPE